MNSLMDSCKRGARIAFAAWAVWMGAVPCRCSAELIWDWSFGGTEVGTFTTNGSLVDAGSSFNFGITNFTVTSSTVSSLAGRPYQEFQPPQGFLWNGVAATQFYRSNGTWTNGSNFYVSDPGSNLYGFLFYADVNGSQASLSDPAEATVVSFSPVTLVPTAVPEPSAWTMALAVACGGLTLVRRRS